MFRSRYYKSKKSYATSKGAFASFLAASLLASTMLAQPLLAWEEKQEDVELAADIITYDPDSGEATAKGRVTLSNDGFILQAGQILYNQNTGVAIATGAVKLTSPDGEVMWSDKITLNSKLKDAFVGNIRLLLTDGAQVAAESATRDGASGSTTLNRAVYSPCEVCEGDPTSEPVWQIKAVKVVHDKDKKRLYYSNAYLELFGVPILWMPKFSHPDPTVDRANGLLPIDMKSTKELGVVVGMPYYYSFSPSRDMTITPILSTKEGLILAGEYRQMLNNGAIDVSGSITYTDKINDFGVNIGGSQLRGNLVSNGLIKHSDKWQSTYKINWASDDTYLRRYDFSKDDTLINEYKLEAFYGPSYFATRALAFQGLRVEDISGLTAFALPIVDAEYITGYKPLGGTFKVNANAVVLVRTEGLDTQRLSLSSTWNKRFITGPGMVIDMNAMVRSDGYSVLDSDRPDDPEFAGNGQDVWRNLARFSSTLAWPFIKSNSESTHILEPVFQADISPNKGQPFGLVNEDSRSFELNHLNLFSSERAAGYDLWEEGSRFTYGLRWQYENKNWQTSMLLGQSIMSSDNSTNFAVGTGLTGNSSDIIGDISIKYKDWIDINHRFRLDDSSFKFRRNEIDLNIHHSKFDLRIAYLKLNRGLEFINREDREEIRAQGRYKFNNKWSLSANLIEDLTYGSHGVEYGTGIDYEDECLQLSLHFRQTYTRDRDIEPGSSLMFRLKLKNLG